MYPCTRPDRPEGLQEIEAPRLSRDNWHKNVREVALRTGCLYPPAKTSDTRF